MLSAMGRISSGRVPGTAFTQGIRASSVMAVASARLIPASVDERTFLLSLVPPQSGQAASWRNFSTRFMPFSSLTLERAFSTVYFAL